MNDIIIYSILIILLPIVPAYILYTLIPDSASPKDDSVEGSYQGLNIRLKGAFAAYFLLALMLSGFINFRLSHDSEYEYWTVEGAVDVSSAGDPGQITFSIEPPDLQKYPNGKFIIKNVPIRKAGNRTSTLILSRVYDGRRIDEVVDLEEEKKPYEQAKKYAVSFKDDKTIAILTPISFLLPTTSAAEIGTYSASGAEAPVPVNP